MTAKLFLLLFAFSIFASCKNADAPAKEKTPVAIAATDTANHDLVIDLAKMLGENAKKRGFDVSIDFDQYFRKSKKYVGFDFKLLLDSAVKNAHFDTTNAVLVFECADGYKPIMPLWKALSETKGYVVYKDKDAKNNWIDSLAARFAPYYLVWQGVKPTDHSFVWPYGLTTVRLTPAVSEFKDIYPSKNPEFVQGFTLFKDNCNRCHALNHVGGVMGPEFNIPKNITEYWKEADILAFSQHPQSYRTSSQMPAMKELVSIEETKAIIGYLKFMAGHKIQ